MSKGFWEYQGEETDALEPVKEEPHHIHHEEISVNCYHHPDRRASSVCPKCQIYYCSECITIRKGKLMCKTCAEVEFAVDDDQIRIGEDEPIEAKIAPERPPDFNPYGTFSHSEGNPSNPLLRIVAYVLDLVVSRIAYFVVFAIALFIYYALSAQFTPMLYGSTISKYWPTVIAFKKWYLFMVFDLIYFFLLLSFKNRTVGMSWLNLRIVTHYGDFVGITSCFLRSVIQVLTYSVTDLIAFFTPRRQSLHDWLASVVVINYSGIKDIDPYETITIEM